MQRLNIRSDLVDPLTWGLSRVTQTVFLSDFLCKNSKIYWIRVYFLKKTVEKLGFFLFFCASLKSFSRSVFQNLNLRATEP